MHFSLDLILIPGLLLGLLLVLLLGIFVFREIIREIIKKLKIEEWEWTSEGFSDTKDSSSSIVDDMHYDPSYERFRGNVYHSLRHYDE